ncbi:uncharacterized protein LOC107046762 [Diachasma alloeum]|uniref:uncharacterized protein LOC107046762 n=1 Tax=Diachasma alloeum TaxID=454923 RepID=UPI0007384CD4|nr:uncharacterized protein LOC107046762 [Diachasma alloeum]
MATALAIVESWCRETDLSVNPAKTTVLVFIRKYKPEMIRPLILNGSVVNYSNKVKYLRKGHSEKLGAKPQNDTVALSDGTVTKANVCCGSLVAKCRNGGNKEPVARPTGNFPEGRGGGHEDHTYRGARNSTQYPAFGPQSQGHTQLGLINANPFTDKSERIQRKYQINKAFKTRIPSREEWLDSKLKPAPKEDYWFTDGFGYTERFGAGIYRLKDGFGESFPLGQHATVFQAEVLGIAKYAEPLIAKETEGMKIFICRDSQAAIKALEESHY